MVSTFAKPATHSQPASGPKQRVRTVPADPARRRSARATAAVEAVAETEDQRDADLVQTSELRVQAPCDVSGQRRVRPRAGGARGGAALPHPAGLRRGVEEAAGEPGLARYWRHFDSQAVAVRMCRVGSGPSCASGILAEPQPCRRLADLRVKLDHVGVHTSGAIILPLKLTCSKQSRNRLPSRRLRACH